MVVFSLRKGLLLLSPAVLVVAAACSSTPPPPAYGNCVPMGDAGCTSSGATPGGGSSGESDATAMTSCQVTSADSLCNQCLYPACCSLITTCLASADCVNLTNCINDCVAAQNATSAEIGSCVDNCKSPTVDPDSESVAAYDDIVTCEEAKCPVCAQEGVGDPCTTSYPSCVTGAMCNGSWCTPKACTQDAECAGIGQSGANAEGTANVCVFVSGTGNTCAPSAPANGCSATYTDTFLDTTTDVSGSPVTVCALIRDGG